MELLLHSKSNYHILTASNRFKKTMNQPRHPFIHPSKSHPFAKIPKMHGIHPDRIRLLGSKIPLGLTPRLLRLDLRRNNGVMHNMWSINSIHRWHPVKSDLPFLSHADEELTSRPSSTGNTHTTNLPTPVDSRLDSVLWLFGPLLPSSP